MVLSCSCAKLSVPFQTPRNVHLRHTNTYSEGGVLKKLWLRPTVENPKARPARSPAPQQAVLQISCKGFNMNTNSQSK